jgi:hypothetical protein
MAPSRKETIKRAADDFVTRRYYSMIASVDLTEALRGRVATDYVWDENQRKFVLVYADEGRQTARANRETTI